MTEEERKAEEERINAMTEEELRRDALGHADVVDQLANVINENVANNASLIAQYQALKAEHEELKASLAEVEEMLEHKNDRLMATMDENIKLRAAQRKLVESIEEIQSVKMKPAEVPA